MKIFGKAEKGEWRPAELKTIDMEDVGVFGLDLLEAAWDGGFFWAKSDRSVGFG